MLDYFFKYPYKLIPVRSVGWNISEVINKNSRGAFNYWDDFSSLCYQRSFQIFSILKTGILTLIRLGYSFWGGMSFFTFLLSAVAMARLVRT